MHTPSALNALLTIAYRGRPFTAVGGRAFITVRAQSLGYQTLAPLPSSARELLTFGLRPDQADFTSTDRAFSSTALDSAITVARPTYE